MRMKAPVPDPLASRLERCYTGAVFDVLRGMGFHDQALPKEIRPLLPEGALAGRVFPVSGQVRDGLDAHESLLRWTEFLSKAPPDTVVVCQPNDRTLAHMGELSAETLHFRGVRGYIVDGGCRDSNFIRKIGFPVFCRYFTPADIVGRWMAETFGDPVEIGGVRITRDDYVLADRDGVILVPGSLAEEVIGRAEETIQTENKVRTAILRGMDPHDAYLRYGKF